MYLSPRKKLFVDTATSKFGVGAILNRQEVQSAADDANIPFPWWFWKTAKVGYNQFQLPSVGGPETVTVGDTPRIPDLIFNLDVPVLGICYGMQAMAQQLGGKVESSKNRKV